MLKMNYILTALTCLTGLALSAILIASPVLPTLVPILGALFLAGIAALAGLALAEPLKLTEQDVIKAREALITFFGLK